MCGDSQKDESVELEISIMNENIVGSKFFELCKSNIFFNDRLSTLGMSDGEENRFSIRTPNIIGISGTKNAIMLVSPQMDSTGNDEKIRTSRQKNGNMDEKMMEGVEEYMGKGT